MGFRIRQEGKRVLFTMVAIVLMATFVELATMAIHFGFMGNLPPPWELSQQRRTLLDRPALLNKRTTRPMVNALAQRVIHPYVGYLYEPHQPSLSLVNKEPLKRPECQVNAHGFFGPGNFRDRSKESFHVLVMGGSMAHQVTCLSIKALRDALTMLPAMADRRLRIFAMTAGAFKQPQQLMALAYYHALGGKADLVINLDGYNEVTEHASRKKHSPHPIYPSDWRINFTSLNTPRTLSILGNIHALRDRQRWLAMATESVNFTMTVNLLWNLMNKVLEADIARHNQALLQSRIHPGRRSFATEGPKEQIEDKQEMAVDIWMRSSLGMAALARGMGARFLHLLQPNQYIQDSKPMGSTERKVAIMEGPMGEERKQSVRQGYRRMRRSSVHLREAGVNFVDLSLLFKGVKDPLYIDDCCHVNQKGNDMLAQAMAAEVRRIMTAAP